MFRIPESVLGFLEVFLESGKCFVPMSHSADINIPRVRNRSSMEKFGHFLRTEKILFLSQEEARRTEIIQQQQYSHARECVVLLTFIYLCYDQSSCLL